MRALILILIIVFCVAYTARMTAPTRIVYILVSEKGVHMTNNN